MQYKKIRINKKNKLERGTFMIRDNFKNYLIRLSLIFLTLLSGIFIHYNAEAFTLNVVDGINNVPITGGFRWLLEEDTTNVTVPGAPVIDSISLTIHNSYAPVAAKGNSVGVPSTAVTVPDINKRYFISVLPDSGFSNGGTVVAVGQDPVTVYVNPLPLPTAQISIYAFVDQNPVNNVWDEHDDGLGGCSIVISDVGGPLSQDVFGNPLGTIYQFDPITGDPLFDPITGAPLVAQLGTGVLTTLTRDDFVAGGLRNPYNLKVGEALIKNLAPGKYGIVLTPPGIDDAGNAIEWVQTSTIEGTPTVDAWVKANEPNLFVEGFGTGFKHAFYGFVKTSPTAPSPYKGQTISMLPWNVTPPAGTGSIEGTLRYNHFAKPPMNQGFFAGELVSECWIGLNDPLAKPGIQPAGLYAAPCDGNSHFKIDNVPAGTYQIVMWDRPLDALFGFNTVIVGPGQAVNLGNVLMFRWFGTFEGTVFYDTNQNGFRDAGEVGMMNQNINIRFRDGSIYQFQPTDPSGEYQFAEVFPFFKWLIVEVDFARYKATGMTTAVDYGGQIPPANGWTVPSFGKLNPQPQAQLNPNTRNNLSRTETGPVLLEAMHLFLNQTNVIDWGKFAYGPGENGGITGVVYYDVTRAENDPRFAAPETWEPGIPRVQVNLYRDNLINATGLPGSDGIIDDINGIASIQLADVDNYPFDSPATPFPGPEDVDRDGNGIFDAGDAIDVAWTDSWDDNKPTGCIQNLPVIHGQPIQPCADSFGTWNQVRPGVFDGGYAFGPAAGGPSLPIGVYIVEAVPPPGYEFLKEEDKNVDFGDSYQPGTLLLPPVCVGTFANTGITHTVPLELSLFPGVPIDAPPAGPAGTVTPLCNMKQVMVSDGRNSASDFYFFTEVPKAARSVGFANNDLGAEFNMASPNFGEKLAPSWIPVSYRDWTGRELFRVYTDEFGGYNALLPSTYSINIPTPSGVSPNMITLVLNDPIKPDGSLDPFYNPTYSVTPWTFQYTPGTTSYLDTPLVPLAAFASAGGSIDTYPPSLSPVISAVTGPELAGGPLVCAAHLPNTVNITSTGITQIINPDYNPSIPGSPYLITRDFGFGTVQGTVTLGGVPLTVNSWSDALITVAIPNTATTGRLMVTRGDNTQMTEIGVILNIVDCATTTVRAVAWAPYPATPIQDAINISAAGDLIIVAPGTYNENVVMYKPVRLQGSGAGSTFISGNPTPLERLQAWHDLVDITLGGADFAAFLLKNPFAESEAPDIIVMGETSYPTGNIQLPNTLCDIYAPDPLNCKTFNLGNPFNTPGQAVIDGFTLSGSKAGGGIFAVSGARYLSISNNNITNNQGNYAGGIAIGTQDNGFDARNIYIVIKENKIHKNGGVQGGGGISMNEYANNYLIEDNLIIGNFSRFNGAGINHRGVSPGDYVSPGVYSPGVNVIRKNKILFNEDHFGALLAKAGDGGGIYIGGDVAGGTGTGSVTIDSNLIQGNLTGSGYGGGIRAFAVNAEDVRLNPSTPANWFELKIINNMIVNNVAALSGAGISLQDVLRPTIVNNTIANNDATATSRLAFIAGQPDSTPQPSGVVSGVHSAILLGLIDPALIAAGEPIFSNPVLANNIIWHNRSYYNNHLLNRGAGGLSPRPAGLYWDLQVTGTNGTMSPQNCILTSTSGYAASNITGDPAFITEYFNSLTSATVLDEGGNSISVRYTPLRAAAGDYHIRLGSPAINNGTNGYLAMVPVDYDGMVRPDGPLADIGADEVISPYIYVTTPNGGENLKAGSVSAITWTFLGNPGPFVRIELFRNGNYNSLITGSTPTGNLGSGSYNWTIPSRIILGGGYQIRVTSTSNGAFTDMSDSTFGISLTGCTYTLTPNGANYTSAGGGGSFNVTTQTGCGWTATTADAWITITPPNAGTGTGPVNYTVTANTGPARTGAIAAGGQTFTITQTGCTYTLAAVAPNPADFAIGGGAGSFTVTTQAGCNWTATTADAWITNILPASGTGPGPTSVNYDVGANAGAPRAGAIAVGGQNFGITQQGTTPTITVALPNGGENIKAGTTYQITWTYTSDPGALVRIELLRNGILSSTITTGTSIGVGGNGSFNWTLPLRMMYGGGYSIRITSTTNGAYTDMSNATFNIIQ